MREMKRALAPVKRRIRAQRAFEWGAWGALVAAACVVGLRAASFLRMFESMWLWAAFAAVGLTGAAALIAAAWPVADLTAARRADALGLMARAQTAVALAGEESPMAQMQRADALKSLRAFDPRRAMKLCAPKGTWIGVLACAAAVALSFLIPNPQDALIARREQFRADMAAQAERVEQGANALDADKPETPEVRRLLGELSQALRRSEDTRDALEAVDRTERRLLSMQQRTAGDAMNALNSAGLQSLAQALENGNGQTTQETLEAMDAQSAADALSDAAQQAGDATAAQALSDAANAMQAGNAAQAAQLLQAAMSGQSGAAAQAMALAAMARSGAVRSGSGSGDGQSGQGSGSGNGASQNRSGGTGMGAGLGSSDGDGGTGPKTPAGNQQGTGNPQKQTGEYETIYDPTRLGGAGETVNESGEIGKGTVTEAQIGTGMGSIDGSVPYGQALPEYQQQAVEAVQNAALPGYAQQWVTDYFESLK